MGTSSWRRSCDSLPSALTAGISFGEALKKKKRQKKRVIQKWCARVHGLYGCGLLGVVFWVLFLDGSVFSDLSCSWGIVTFFSLFMAKEAEDLINGNLAFCCC